MGRHLDARSGQWSAAEQPCRHTRALFVKSQNKRKATLCAGDPRARRCATGTLIKKRSRQDPGSGSGVQMPASLACQARTSLRSLRPCTSRTRTGLPQTHTAPARGGVFGFRNPASWIHRLQCHQLLGELDRRLAKHVFREDRAGGQSHVTVQQTSGYHSYRLVQQIVAQGRSPPTPPKKGRVLCTPRPSSTVWAWRRRSS